ncbi:hypothetical protein C8R47DRAFT_1218950 [Mycena vitilis]|nr:hypothetical protein C8R47DRAFT_1218950 [Mycena vitilis]
MASENGSAAMGPLLLFPDLPPDVIFSIFAHCDISTVVSAGQTCRYLHNLAFDKSVWLALVDNLRRRSILDQNRTPSIKNLSTEQLIQVVKCTVAGPAAWSPFNSDSMAEAHAKITLHPAVYTGDGILYWENVVKLTSSGRYVLFNNSRSLECWSVADDTMIWKHKSAIKYASTLEFAVEETENGQALSIMVCLRTYPHAYSDRKNYVEIIRLDLRSRAQNTLVTTRAPNSQDDGSFSLPVIRGALAVVATSSQRDHYMIINWKTRSFFLLKCRPVRHNALLLIPHHLVLKTLSLVEEENEEPVEEDTIHIISHDALRTYWAPTIDVGVTAEFASVSVHDMEKLDTIVTPLSFNKWPFFEAMSMTDSPLRDSEYRLWIHASADHRDQSYGYGQVGALVGYQLAVGRDGERPRWRSLGMFTPLVPSHYQAIIPYSGHTLSWDGSSAFRISPLSSPSQATVSLPDSGDYVDVAPYSGALTYSTHESIVIIYFA